MLAACDAPPAPVAVPPAPAAVPPAAAPPVAAAPAPTAPMDTPSPRTPRPPFASAFLDAVLADPASGVEWAQSGPFDVMQEHPVEDVRDLQRVFDATRGVWKEVPRDGTVNPSRVAMNEGRVARAQALAARHARLAGEILRRFRETIAAPVGLPDVSAKPIGVLAVWTDPAWRRWTNASAETDLVVWRFGADELRRDDELSCVGGRVQKESDAESARLLVRLLLRRATDASATPPPWLVEGVAELVAGVEIDGADADLLVAPSWTHERVRSKLVLAARFDRFSAQRWTLAHVVQMKEIGSAVDAASGRSLESAAELWLCRAWAFCHFLRHYDGGKYRDKLTTFLGEALKGPKTSDDFARAMGRPDAAHWGDVETEYEWYWDQLLARKVGRSRMTREPHAAPTDAPPGRVEDDEDWLAVWREEHARAK
jgi:hypothetical protein